MFLTGVLTHTFIGRQAGHVGLMLLVVSLMSCYFSRKFETGRVIVFIKLFLYTMIFYLAWNIIAEIAVGILLDHAENTYLIVAALSLGWAARILTILMPYLLYRHIIKNEENFF